MRFIEQINQNLNKLIEVVKPGESVRSCTSSGEPELVKIKATVCPARRVKRIPTSSWQIVEWTSSVYTVHLAGTSDKLDSFIEAIGPDDVIEVVPTACRASPAAKKC